jgi:RNase H-like domain found in reverse transcriptase
MTTLATHAFETIQDLLLHHATLIIMNEYDPLILYTDASTKAIAGVLMQEQ